MAQSAVELLSEVVVDLTEEVPIRVLHVDDEVGFLKVAKQCLEMQGPFQVEPASSVEEAMEKMKEKTFDVVVSDYVMPEKDGLEFLRELRASGNNIPFIIFTGKGREEVAIKALNLGADRYFNKVGDPETVYGELTHGIRRAVERKRASMEVWRREERLRAVLTSSPDAVTVIDLNGNIVECNQATLDLYGWSSKDEIIGKNGFEFVARKDHQRAIEDLKKVLEQGSIKNGEKVSLISVYYEEDGKDQLKLVYEDNGVGIPKAEKEKIFKEGYGKGTGYGLYLIRKICEVYGWNIRETGKRGKGAQFTITIPKTKKNGKEQYLLH